MFEIDGTEPSLSEEEALRLVAALKRRTLHSIGAFHLAVRLEREARSARPSRRVILRAEERIELRLTLDELERSGELTDRLRSLQTVLHGQRRGGNS
ncbi:MAG: hypothetical protein ACRDQ2_13035 [Gaiellales bacterium]